MASVHTPLVRSLPAARSAFDNQDIALSKAVHAKKVSNAEEGHNSSGDVIKSVVFGGLDGILTTFAIVSGATGGGMSTAVILILGFSNKIGDALSMGLGDALSTKAEHEHVFQVSMAMLVLG
jgi:VIT1/CCC1 family predicted Fe2+/Mn2+ transporter